MLLSGISLYLCLAASASAAAIERIPIIETVPTSEPVPAAFLTSDPEVTPTPIPGRLFKRRVIATTTSETLSLPSPWLRTVSSTHVELVTPAIIGGVTFSAKPKNVKTPLPWLSVHPNGYLKTILPKVKNGITQNASPDYGNYFDIPVTSTISLGDVIKEHKGTGQMHEDITYIAEPNQEDRLLNPIMRCTPDRYFKKKVQGDKITQKPFCSPGENTNIILGETHWITWYTRYFPDAKKVRLHMAYIDRGKNGNLDKRDFAEEDTFFTTDWIDNLDGVYPLEITSDDLLNEPIQNVVLSIQPDTVEDEDFNLVNGTQLILRMYPLKQKKMKKLKMENSADDSAVYVALTIPTIIVVFVCGYAIINYMFKDNRTWKKIKIKSRRRTLNNNRYTTLPTNTYELSNR